MPNENPSATPSLDLMNDPNPTGYRKCKLKEGALPHYVRRGKVVAGDEFVTEARHAKELFETGAVEILGTADGPDLSPSERVVKEGEEAAKKREAERAQKLKDEQEKAGQHKPAPAAPAAPVAPTTPVAPVSPTA